MGSDDDLTDRLVKSLWDSFPRDIPHVRISIPTDHPKYEAILRLARLLASEQRLASGIHVKKIEIPGALEEFLRALRAVVPQLDDMLEKLAAARPELRNPTMLDLLKIAGTALPILAAEGVVPKDTAILLPPK